MQMEIKAWSDLSDLLRTGVLCRLEGGSVGDVQINFLLVSLTTSEKQVVRYNLFFSEVQNLYSSEHISEKTTTTKTKKKQNKVIAA